MNNNFIRIGGGIVLRAYQKAILKAFDNGIRYIVLCWSRRCLAANTKVLTVNGLVEAKDLSVGDKVVSYGDGYETGVISHVGIVSSPKPMIELDYGDERIRTSYDHPFYFNGVYAPLFLIIWGNLEASQRAKLKLLCEQYGESIDDQLEKCEAGGDYEASIRQIRLLQDSFQWTNYQDTQRGGEGFPSESDWIAAGKSYRQQQDKQPSRKPGMVYRETQLRAYDETGASVEELGREMWNAYTYITTSFANQGFMEHSDGIQAWSSRTFGTNILKDSRTQSEEIGSGSQRRNDTAHTKKPNVEILEAEPLYEITVEGNSNYFIGRRCLLNHNCGKSLLSWNLLIREATTKPGTYWYCFNNYSTAYNDIWIAQTSKGVRFLDMIPKNMIVRMNSAKLEIELTNGSVIKLIGINNVDKLVGAGLMGVVFDEYAVLNPNSIELVTAMLAETGGWRVMISTPRGKNHFYEEYQFALAHPEFALANNMHCGMEEVAQFMAPGFLEQERLKIISKYGNDALYQQEYMTSWVSPNSGSVFGALTKIMKDEGRVTVLQGDSSRQYYTAWDLGSADYTSIVLFQVDDKGFPTVLDHIENRNEDVTWYLGEIKERGWQVHTHFLPHDAAHRRGARNESYKRALELEGVTNTVVLSKPNRVEDKLNFLRRVFVGLQIDERLTRVIECLEKMEYEWNEKQHVWSSKPTHKGGYSDTVDSLCYMGQAIQKYNITGKTGFSRVSIKNSAAGGVQGLSKKEQLEKFLEAELSLGGKKKKRKDFSLFRR